MEYQVYWFLFFFWFLFFNGTHSHAFLVIAKEGWGKCGLICYSIAGSISARSTKKDCRKVAHRCALGNAALDLYPDSKVADPDPR
jgi:hypothetical protein